MNQVIIFQNEATENPDAVIGYSRYVFNDNAGIGIEELKRELLSRIPPAQNPETKTLYRILYVERYDCPCCPTMLRALIDVGCEGLFTDEWREVTGMYEISFTAVMVADRHCNVSVNKLVPRTVSEGTALPLPRKDYRKIKGEGTYRG
jgi:hypothetical protein